jgi:hypothetical protein
MGPVMRDMQWCGDGQNHRVVRGERDINPMPREGDLEACLRQFVQALQSCGAGEVISPSDRDLAEPFGGPDNTCSTKVRVLDEGLWYDVVAEVATAVRAVPGVTMVLRLDRVSELDLDVPPWVPPAQRCQLLSEALIAATRALLTRRANADRHSEGWHQAQREHHRQPPGEWKED